MKQYISERLLRIVGTGREIRHQLSRLSLREGKDVLLIDFAASMPPIKAAIGSSGLTEELRPRLSATVRPPL